MLLAFFYLHFQASNCSSTGSTAVVLSVAVDTQCNTPRHYTTTRRGHTDSNCKNKLFLFQKNSKHFRYFCRVVPTQNNLGYPVNFATLLTETPTKRRRRRPNTSPPCTPSPTTHHEHQPIHRRAHCQSTRLFRRICRVGRFRRRKERSHFNRTTVASSATTAPIQLHSDHQHHCLHSHRLQLPLKKAHLCHLVEFVGTELERRPATTVPDPYSTSLHTGHDGRRRPQHRRQQQ